MMYRSSKTYLVSESKEFIMWGVVHLLEVTPVEQVVLTYQHLQIVSEHSRWISHFDTAVNHCIASFDYLFPWLLDLHQDGDNEQQQHHPRGHADHGAMSLCDLVKNTFALFLWVMDSVWGEWQREIKYEADLEAQRVHQSYIFPTPPVRTDCICGCQEQFGAFPESQSRD